MAVNTHYWSMYFNAARAYTSGSGSRECVFSCRVVGGLRRGVALPISTLAISEGTIASNSRAAAFGGETTVYRPSSDGSISRMSSDKSVLSLALVKGPPDSGVASKIADVVDLMDRAVLAKRSIWSARDGIV
jgi:hypothetical protein